MFFFLHILTRSFNFSRMERISSLICDIFSFLSSSFCSLLAQRVEIFHFYEHHQLNIYADEKMLATQEEEVEVAMKEV